MPFVTLDQAAMRIVHKVTRDPIKLRTLQRWVQQHPDVADKRYIKSKRQQHYLEEADLQALLRYYPDYELLPAGKPLSRVLSLSLSVQQLEQDINELRRLVLMALAERREVGDRILTDMVAHDDLMSRELEMALATEPHVMRPDMQEERAYSSVHLPAPRKKPSSKKALSEEEIAEIRHYWVGRGETFGKFSLFIYCQIAHGHNPSSAGTQCVTAKARLAAGEVPRFQVTPVKFNGRDDCNLITEDQAVFNINQTHREACGKSKTDIVPESNLCFDPRCPVCSILRKNEEGYIRLWTIADILGDRKTVNRES